jgi:hypothetical protein
MKVKFAKIAPRRYGVLVERMYAPNVAMWPAPGYDEYLPHDLLHFVAEAEWRLDGAVFGQLARGGDAGTFIPVDKSLIPKTMRRRKLARKGKPRGRRSEVLAHLLHDAWHARNGHQPLPSDWEESLAAARVTPTRLERVLASLDDLADQWHSLHVGESLTLEWPRPERRPHRRAARATA